MCIPRYKDLDSSWLLNIELFKWKYLFYKKRQSNKI